jgi:hypothetical protein
MISKAGPLMMIVPHRLKPGNLWTTQRARLIYSISPERALPLKGNACYYPKFPYQYNEAMEGDVGLVDVESRRELPFPVELTDKEAKPYIHRLELRKSPLSGRISWGSGILTVNIRFDEFESYYHQDLRIENILSLNVLIEGPEEENRSDREFEDLSPPLPTCFLHLWGTKGENTHDPRVNFSAFLHRVDDEKNFYDPVEMAKD